MTPFHRQFDRTGAHDAAIHLILNFEEDSILSPSALESPLALSPSSNRESTAEVGGLQLGPSQGDPSQTLVLQGTVRHMPTVGKALSEATSRFLVLRQNCLASFVNQNDEASFFEILKILKS